MVVRVFEHTTKDDFGTLFWHFNNCVFLIGDMLLHTSLKDDLNGEDDVLMWEDDVLMGEDDILVG